MPWARRRRFRTSDARPCLALLWNGTLSVSRPWPEPVAAAASGQPAQRLALERPGEVRHRPARLEEERRLLVHVVHQEDARAEAGEEPVARRAVERIAGGGGGALEAVEHAQLVALGLESAEEPGADVRERLVVEVDRILGRDHDAEPVGARLLEEREERLLGRRIRDRREEAEELVEEDERAQARAARLRAHPGHGLVEQERDEEAPLRLGEVRERDDREPRPARVGPEERIERERLAREPRLEARRGEQLVHPEREREPLARGQERLEVHRPDARDGRPLEVRDEGREVVVPPRPPGRGEERRDQDVLAAPERIGVDAGEREEAGGRGLDPVADEVAVVEDRRGRGGERGEDRERPAQLGAGRVERHLRGVAQAADPVAVLIPGREPGAPPFRLGRGERLAREPLPFGLLRADVRQEVAGREVGEGEQQVREVALRIDHQRRDAVERRLFEEHDAEAGLAAPGHADDRGVGHEVAHVVEERLSGGRQGRRVQRPAEVEPAELLVGLAHGRAGRS
jgi:hypothetical protein